MTAMDILEALGQVQEETLCGCDGVICAAEDKKADIPVTGRKYRRAAAGLLAAAAVLLLVYVGSGAYMSRNFDSGSSGNSQSTSMSESADIADDAAEERSVVEESETVEMEEESAVTTDSKGETSGAAAESATDTEEAQTETEAQTDAAALETLQLGEVYIAGFATSTLSDREYAEWMELAALVQAEIDAALSQKMYETLPVYRFVRTEEFASDQNQVTGDAGASQSEQSDDTDRDLPERLGDYPVITAEEAEELLWQGYYIAATGFSEDDIDSAETVSVELQYLISAETQIYMPYYQFTAVVDDDMVFVCCVPAVSSEYLKGTLNGGIVE